MNVLGVRPATTGWRDGADRREVGFEDWTIDDVPLCSLVAGQEMTRLCAEANWPKGAVESLRRLLGEEPGDFEDGRVSLLVCPLDGDLACSTFSARVTFEDDWVGWSDFGWQVNYEPFEPMDSPPADVRFEREAYERLLNALLRKYSSLEARCHSEE
jgi:hypothetical protein